jgi:hypothetical protein
MGEFDRLLTPKNWVNMGCCYSKIVNKRRQLVEPV